MEWKFHVRNFVKIGYNLQGRPLETQTTGIHTTQGMHRSKTSVKRVLVLTLENKCFPIRQ